MAVPSARSTAVPMFDLTVQEINGEPRMRDLDIAEALGFERPRNIRKLIERCLDHISGFGEVICSTLEQLNQRGPDPSEYWLNEHQAFYLCTQSRAARAFEVTKQIIRVFVAWRNDRLSPPGAAPDAGRVLTPDMMDIKSLVTEARLTFGRAAAQIMWRRMGMPDLPDEPGPADPPAPAPDGHESILLFLQEECLITGKPGDFTRSRDVYAAYKAFMDGDPPLGSKQFAQGMIALSRVYRCPSSKGRLRHAKSNNVGYRGLRLLHR